MKIEVTGDTLEDVLAAIVVALKHHIEISRDLGIKAKSIASRRHYSAFELAFRETLEAVETMVVQASVEAASERASHQSRD